MKGAFAGRKSPELHYNFFVRLQMLQVLHIILLNVLTSQLTYGKNRKIQIERKPAALGLFFKPEH